MAKILIIEDTVTISDLIKYSLEKNKHQVDAVYDGKNGLDYAYNNNYDLIFIDVMLPILDGFTLCEKIRNINKSVYIIFITALNDEENILKGLSIGGDDYISKPFSIAEVIARTDAALRRIERNIEVEEDVIESNILGNNIHLTDIEYKLFKELLKYKNKVLTRDNLLKTIWGFNYDGKTRILDVHINNLKKKIKSRFTISPIRGKGYKLVDKL